MTFEVNQLIDGKYTVRKKIDEGGFGAIYEVSCPGVSYFEFNLILNKQIYLFRSYKLDMH